MWHVARVSLACLCLWWRWRRLRVQGLGPGGGLAISAGHLEVAAMEKTNRPTRGRWAMRDAKNEESAAAVADRRTHRLAYLADLQI
jgi:hypothetical protein